MAEQSGAGVPALSTNIESGKFDEKETHPVPAAKQPVEEQEDEDEDIDALIDDLESNDGHGDVSSTSFSRAAVDSNWLARATPPLRRHCAAAAPVMSAS